MIQTCSTMVVMPADGVGALFAAAKLDPSG
jgi:hypothetical protein